MGVGGGPGPGKGLRGGFPPGEALQGSGQGSEDLSLRGAQSQDAFHRRQGRKGLADRLAVRDPGMDVPGRIPGSDLQIFPAALTPHQHELTASWKPLLEQLPECLGTGLGGQVDVQVLPAQGIRSAGSLDQTGHPRGEGLGRHLGPRGAEDQQRLYPVQEHG